MYSSYRVCKVRVPLSFVVFWNGHDADRLFPSPEILAKLGRDYTVYAYDYSEYETPLVGQGMLSWVLASASRASNSPAHQSSMMVTGRVCRNILGIFSKGAQETLEVKLRLVPVPTVLQAEHLGSESMNKSRQLSDAALEDFDSKSWTNFVRQNPNFYDTEQQQWQPSRTASPLDQSGIERVHQILSECSTPRDLPSMSENKPLRAASPALSTALSTFAPPSRLSTPGGQYEANEQPQRRLNRSQSDMVLPSSSASVCDTGSKPIYAERRDSIQSGYGSADEPAEPQPPPRKRAKLYRTAHPGKEDFNIERKPMSLRVAASTAASVRIHRPSPINPSAPSAQQPGEEPVRPPTPISLPNNMPTRKERPQRSQLREMSFQSSDAGGSPFAVSDNQPAVDVNTDSPGGESCYQGLFEPSFSMPSSPPIVHFPPPNQSSPILPPLTTDFDSGFMSAGLEDLLGDDTGIPLDEFGKEDTGGNAGGHQQFNSPGDENIVLEDLCGEDVSTPLGQCCGISSNEQVENKPQANSNSNSPAIPNIGFPEEWDKENMPALPPVPDSVTRRAPSRTSDASPKQQSALAPLSEFDIDQLINSMPASDFFIPDQPKEESNVRPLAPHPGPMTSPIRSTIRSPIRAPSRPAHPPSTPASSSTAATRKKKKQNQERLDKAIRKGEIPPYCENCGTIDTPTWRRIYWKDIEGTEKDASKHLEEETMIFWVPIERDDQDNVSKFRVYTKMVADESFGQTMLCNRESTLSIQRTFPAY